MFAATLFLVIALAVGSQQTPIEPVAGSQHLPQPATFDVKNPQPNNGFGTKPANDQHRPLSVHPVPLNNNQQRPGNTPYNNQANLRNPVPSNTQGSYQGQANQRNPVPNNAQGNFQSNLRNPVPNNAQGSFQANGQTNLKNPATSTFNGQAGIQTNQKLPQGNLQPAIHSTVKRETPKTEQRPAAQQTPSTNSKLTVTAIPPLKVNDPKSPAQLSNNQKQPQQHNVRNREATDKSTTTTQKTVTNDHKVPQAPLQQHNLKSRDTKTVTAIPPAKTTQVKIEPQTIKEVPQNQKPVVAPHSIKTRDVDGYDVIVAAPEDLTLNAFEPELFSVREKRIKVLPAYLG